MRAVATYPEDLSWLVARTGAGLTADARGIKAVDSSNKIRGMVVYDQWAHSSCQAHMAVDHSIAWRGLLPAVFEYPFLECGLEVIVGVIPGDNSRSLRMVERLGFRRAHNIHDGWRRGVGLHIFEMRRADCRYVVQYPASQPHGRHLLRASVAAEAPTSPL